MVALPFNISDRQFFFSVLECLQALVITCINGFIYDCSNFYAYVPLIVNDSPSVVSMYVYDLMIVAISMHMFLLDL